MSANIKRILVVGSTGFLGKPVAKSLMNAGYYVRLLARNSEKTKKMFGENVDIITGDVTIPESLEDAVKECYGIHINLHGYAGKKNFYNIEYKGIENIAKAAADAGVSHITMLSGATVSSESTEYYAKAKYLGEQALLNCPVPATIFRASWFMETLNTVVKGKNVFMIGNQPHPVHIIAVKDFIGMVIKTFNTPEAGNKVLYAYGPEALTLRETLERYIKILIPGGKIKKMPLWLIWALSRVGETRLRFIYDLMSHFEKCSEPFNVEEETNKLLGANTTSLDKWLSEQAKKDS